MLVDKYNLSDSSDIIDKLKEKGAQLPCPRCGKSQFHIIGESVISVFTKQSGWARLNPQSLAAFYPSPVESSSIPIIIIGCDNCGYLKVLSVY